MVDNNLTISILNDLIQTSKDGEQGFQQAAEHVQDSQLKAFFIRRSHEVSISVAELQDLVVSLGGIPADSSTFGGSLHRYWIDLKTAVVSNDSLAVLNEVERGEDHALNAYLKASEYDFPPLVRSVILRQLNGAQRNHDEVKALRDNAEATTH